MLKIEDIAAAKIVGSSKWNNDDYFDNLPKTPGTWKVEKFGFFKAKTTDTNSYLCVVLKGAAEVRTINLRWGILGTKIDAESLEDVPVAVGTFVDAIRDIYETLNGEQTAEEQVNAFKDLVGKDITSKVSKSIMVLMKDGKGRYRLQQRLVNLL